MDASDILQRAKELEVVLTLADGQIRYNSIYGTPPDFVEVLRQHKPEIIERLEFEGLERRVQHEGFVLCYAKALNDRVAFHKDGLDLTAIPVGFTAYSLSELAMLFGPGQPDVSIRLVHEAKKLGMRVKSNEPDMGEGSSSK